MLELLYPKTQMIRVIHDRRQTMCLVVMLLSTRHFETLVEQNGELNVTVKTVRLGRKRKG